MRKVLAIGSFLLLTLMASPMSANVIATRTNVNAVVFSDAAAHLIPLNAAGSTSFSFFTATDNQRVVISFNAECSAAAANFNTWLNIDVLVDGTAAPPSSNDNAFCTSHGVNALNGWVSAVTNVVVLVPDPGLHTVQVRGNLVGFAAGNAWRIDDSSTIVIQ